MQCRLKKRSFTVQCMLKKSYILYSAMQAEEEIHIYSTEQCRLNKRSFTVQCRIKVEIINSAVLTEKESFTVQA